MIYLKSLMTGVAAMAAFIILAAAWVLFCSGRFDVSNGSINGSFDGSSVVLFGGLGLLIFATGFGWSYRKASRQVRFTSR